MKLPLVRLSFSVAFTLASAGALSVGACAPGAAPIAPIPSSDDSGVAPPLEDAAPIAPVPSSDDSGATTPLEDAAPPAIDSSPLDTGAPAPIADSSPNADPTKVDSSASDLDSSLPPPPPEDAGGGSSPYAVSCSSTSSTCPGTLQCQGFSLGDGAIDAYACTQPCTTTADCGASPAGFPPVVCAPSTMGSFCVLSCDATITTGCPSPLTCVSDEGPPLCLTL